MEALACLKQSSVYHNQGNVSASAALAAEGIELAPADARALRLRLDGNVAITSTWLHEGPPAVARACMRIAAEATTAGWEHFAAIGFHNLGVAYRLMGRLREAETHLERASKFWSQVPSNPFSDNNELATVLLMIGEVRKAEQVALMGCNSTRPWPRPNAEAHIALAAVRIQQGAFSEAISILTQLLSHVTQLGGLRADAYSLLIEALYFSQPKSEVLVHTLEATDGMPRDPRLAPLINPTESVALHSRGGCRGGCQRTADMLREWDAKGAHAPAVVGMVKLSALALEHRGRRATDQAVFWLSRAAEGELVPYLRWWLRRYGPFAPLLAESEQGLRLLVTFLQADPEFWRSPLTRLLPTLTGDRRQLLLGAIVKFANKATAVALASMPGQDIAAARKHLTRQQAARIYIRAFGSLMIQRGDKRGPVTTVEKRRLRALLGLLVVHSRQVLSRDAALDLLWPDADPAAAVNNLNQSVFQLRRVLNPNHRDGESPQYLISTPDALQLDTELVRTDLDDFRSIAARLAAAPPRERRRLASEIVDLVRGEFLADLKYEEWMPRIETSIHAEVREILLPLARGESESADLSVRAACALTLLDEFDESATIAMARQLAASGKRSAAREVVTRFAAKLRDELDEPPSAELAAALEGFASSVSSNPS
jgi:DNA-binding SARP family transcriptional activator